MALFLKKLSYKIPTSKGNKMFIADFYCHKAGLIIEIDGSQHYTEDGMVHDSERTAILSEFNLEVIRFSNCDVDDNFEGVCFKIDDIVSKKLGIKRQVFD